MTSMTGEARFNQEREDLETDLKERIDSENLPTVNIMVAGITGTGKSTLLNAIFGENLAATGSGDPVTKHINEYRRDEIPIAIWDTVGLELDSQNTQESINSIKKTIASKSGLENKYDRIHAIWYCINSGSNRYQGVELDFIKDLYDLNVPFIIVLTQCSGDEGVVNNFENEIRKINASKGMSDIDIVQVLAKSVRFKGSNYIVEPFGLTDLVNLTLRKLPEFIKSGFIAAQKQDQSLKREECEKIIYDYVCGAKDGLYKVPIINVFKTDDTIMKMFKKLGTMYNTVLPDESIKQVIEESGVDFKNNFLGLISPIDMGYSKKITNELQKKKTEGFTVRVADIDTRDRAARMIALYGYAFITSFEKIWKDLTEVELTNVNTVCKKLTKYVNDFLKLHVGQSKGGK